MKKIIPFVKLTLLFAIIFLTTYCNDSNDIVNTSHEALELDIPTEEQVLIDIDEYVLVTPPDKEKNSPYYEWRDVALYSCHYNPLGGDHCFPGVINDNFTTPQSSRIEGGNTITTQYFRIYYNSKSNCRPSGSPPCGGLGNWWVPYFHVWTTSTHYLNENHSIAGGTACSTTCVQIPHYTDWYTNTLNNVNLPSNSTVYVAYGVDVIAD